MQLGKKVILLVGIICVAAVAALFFFSAPKPKTEAAGVDFKVENKKEKDYQRAAWDPVHFKPAIDGASDEKCLSCHQEILKNTVRKESLAGVKSDGAMAWYQTLDTYEGDQSTFHLRHLKSPYATQVMQMKCTTCHQGSDPRDRAVNPPNVADTSHTLRKDTNPDTCLMCHGKFPNENMGLPQPWPEMRDAMGNNCLACHAAIRTSRHQVNFLKPEAIEKLAAEKGGDVCFGCHGGRQWYRISFPYPRHAWSGMATEVPDWAKNRPTQSDVRFLTQVTNTSTSTSGSKP